MSQPDDGHLPPALLPGLLLAVLATWLGGLSGGFVWDDSLVLVHNPPIRDLANLGRFFSDPHTGASSDAQLFYRPLRTCLYALGYQLWGMEPLGYHLLNLGLHLLNVWLLLGVLRRLGVTAAHAFLTSAIFGLHPIVTEAVTNITGLTDVLFVCFALLAWRAHLRAWSGAGPRWRWALGAGLAFAAALLSKEMALTLPALMLAGDAITGRTPQRGQRAPYAVYLGALALLAGGFVALRTWLLGDLGQGADWPGGNPGRTWLMQAHGTVKYLQLIALPVGQSIRHSLPIPDGLGDPRALASVAIVAALAGGGAVAAVVGRRPGGSPTMRYVGLGVAWFFIALAPAMNLIPIRGAMLGERFLYLPMVGLVLALVSLIGPSFGPERRRATVAGCCALLLALAGLTVRRNAVWQSDLTAFEDALQTSPDSNAVRLNLARVYREQGRHEQARAQLIAGAENTRRNAARYVDLGDLEAASGDTEEAAWWYRRAQRMVPDDPRAQLGLLRLRAAGLQKQSGR